MSEPERAFMAREQLVPALICALLAEGVAPQTIERAVARMDKLRLGESICSGDPLRRAFSWEQAALLGRKVER